MTIVTNNLKKRAENIVRVPRSLADLAAEPQRHPRTAAGQTML